MYFVVNKQSTTNWINFRCARTKYDEGKNLDWKSCLYIFRCVFMMRYFFQLFFFGSLCLHGWLDGAQVAQHYWLNEIIRSNILETKYDKLWLFQLVEVKYMPNHSNQQSTTISIRTICYLHRKYYSTKNSLSKLYIYINFLVFKLWFYYIDQFASIKLKSVQKA